MTVWPLCCLIDLHLCWGWWLLTCIYLSKDFGPNHELWLECYFFAEAHPGPPRGGVRLAPVRGVADCTHTLSLSHQYFITSPSRPLFSVHTTGLLAQKAAHEGQHVCFVTEASLAKPM